VSRVSTKYLTTQYRDPRYPDNPRYPGSPGNPRHRRIPHIPRPLYFVALCLVLLIGAAVAIRTSQRTRAATTSYTALTSMGMPSSPQSYYPTNGTLDITTEERGNISPSGALHEPMSIADHGPDCSPPADVPTAASSHTVTKIQDAVYVCHDHVMTALDGDSGYAQATMLPAALVDFSQGTAVVTFSVSTFRSSQRDWIELDLTPYAGLLAAPDDSDSPDLQGMPETVLRFRMDNFNGGTGWRGELYTNGSARGLSGPAWQGYEQFLTPSRSVRTQYRLEISAGHVKFGIPSINQWYVDTNVSVPFNQAFVQLSDHSYTPTKDSPNSAPTEQRKLGQGAEPNTWHWSDLNISPAVPLYMAHPDRRFVYAGSGGTDTITFARPAPANSRLKFLGVATDSKISYSTDSGATWAAAARQPSTKPHTFGELYDNWFVPIPAGATSVKFKASGSAYGAWFVRDPVLISTTVDSSAPTPKPAAPSIAGFTPGHGQVGTAVVITGSGFTGATGVMFGGASTTQFSIDSDTRITARVPSKAQSGPIMVMGPNGDATSSASFTVDAPTSRPIPIDGVPCTVTLPSGTQSGTCSGTFTANP
jgi:hypothetical protein